MSETLYVKCPECIGEGKITEAIQPLGGKLLGICHTCRGLGVVPATEEQIEAASMEITKRKMAEFMDRTGHYD